jgi:predicted TIM-barrel fold metal-dependent hydrolase
MLDETGISRGVTVHAGANGHDCSVTLDALRRSAGRLRGVVVPSPDIGDDELAAMHADGVRGMRFTQTAPPGAPAANGVLDFADLERFAPRLRALGWHAQIWAHCATIVREGQRLIDYGIPIVVDHMGYFDRDAGPDGADFCSFVDLLASGSFWVKMTPIRNSAAFPDYADVRPFHDRLLEAAPDRLLFGSDWPFIGLGDKAPTSAHMLDLFCEWTPGEALRRQILVDNPTRLYGF